MPATGEARSYPIARNTRDYGHPEVRTGADLGVIWLIDPPRARIRYDGVWCALDRRTGKLAGAGGPFPAGASETAGFPPAQ